MSGFLTILVSTALVNNLVLVQLLGVSSLFRSSNRVLDAAILSTITAVVLVTTSVVSYLLFHLLLAPLNLASLQLLTILLVAGSCTVLVVRQLDRWLPERNRRQNLNLFMTGGNSAVIGVALLSLQKSPDLMATLAYSLGAALGFGLILVLFAALRERLRTAAIPGPFRGLAIELICAGLVAMALLGLAGVV